MTLTIDISPQIGAQIFATARLNGIALSEVVAKALTRELPVLQSPLKNEVAEAMLTTSVDDSTQAATIAMLQTIIAEVPTDYEELSKANAEFEEFAQNPNANRITVGERSLFS